MWYSNNFVVISNLSPLTSIDLEVDLHVEMSVVNFGVQDHGSKVFGPILEMSPAKKGMSH